MRNKLTYDKWIFTDSQQPDNQLAEGSFYLETSLPASALGVDTMELTVKCSDPSIKAFTPNAPMTYFYRDRQKALFYLQSVERVGPDRYILSGLSALGRLEKMPHPGGIYTGQTVEEVVRDICGSVPVHIKTSLQDVQLYGWLPYVKPPDNSARDNLAQVLFVIGAYLGTDMEGFLRVEPLWDGVASTVTMDRMYSGGSVPYESPISAVSVTEHQYIQGTEETTLYDGTAQEGQLVTFDEPMHSLKVTGFSILSSGANWARLSTGTGTLTGKGYIHTTRQVVKTVTEGAAENVKTITDATLVSLVSSNGVASRLADYYRCQETINSGLTAIAEKPGHVVSIWHPYDKRMVTACIGTMEFTMSAVLRADITALVGFLPPQPEELQYYDAYEELTGTGEWDPPEGVTVVTAVLISGGFGGFSGCRGGVSSDPTELSDDKEKLYGWNPGYGAEGGPGGQPGPGGKILVADIPVTPGIKVPYSTGIGGLGGQPSEANQDSNPGQEGGATTFGPLSSADGAVSPTGYTNPLTGRTYATPGDLQGIAGGRGAGASTTAEYGYEPGTSIMDRDGNTWLPGAMTSVADNVMLSDGEYYIAQAGKGSGGGPAVGANGFDGALGSVSGTKPENAKAVGGRSGNGADAKAPSDQTIPGKGGDGGHGGGGEGGVGLAVARLRENTSITRGRPGKGSEGARGGPGILILFYRRPKPGQKLLAAVTKNKRWRLDKLGRRCIV